MKGEAVMAVGEAGIVSGAGVAADGLYPRAWSNEVKACSFLACYDNEG